VTGVSVEYPRRRDDSLRTAACRQYKDATVPYVGPAGPRRLPCRLRNSEIPEPTPEGRYIQSTGKAGDWLRLGLQLCNQR